MSCGLNKVMVISHFGRVPEMRFTPNGTSVADFSIDCDRSWKTADGQKHTETEWFNGVALGSLADSEGRLQSRTWQDKEGQNQRSVEIMARDLLLLNSQHKQDQMDDQ
jgi:single-strand DNA-binding protein